LREKHHQVTIVQLNYSITCIWKKYWKI